MGQGETVDTPLVVSVPDVADSRLFIELSSFCSDLMEAHHALELVKTHEGSDSPLADASPYLVGFATVAYCRTVLHSNVRRPMTDVVDVPAEFAAIHEQVRSFRNATIAHSQSDLAVTYPVAVFDPATHDFLYISGATMTTPMPLHVVREFQCLVEVMMDRVEVAIEAVRARLATHIQAFDVNELLALPRPTITMKMPREFNQSARATQGDRRCFGTIRRMATPDGADPGHAGTTPEVRQMSASKSRSTLLPLDLASTTAIRSGAQSRSSYHPRAGARSAARTHDSKRESRASFRRATQRY